MFVDDGSSWALMQVVSIGEENFLIVLIMRRTSLMKRDFASFSCMMGKVFSYYRANEDKPYACLVLTVSRF